MSRRNIIFSNKDIEMYNPQVKERFIIETYENINTQNTMRHNFHRFKDFEEFYEKDLYAFNYNEMKDLITGMNSKTAKSLDSKISIISSYLEWARKEHYHNNYIKISDLITKSDVRNNISTYAITEQYLKNKEELFNIVDFCVNKQDAVLFVLAYEGVRGVELEEMRNLKVSDCDFENNTLRLTGSYDGIGISTYERIITVAPESMKIIKEATQETEYYKSNGNVNPNCKAPIFKIAKSEYVVRYTVSRKNSVSDRVDMQNLNKRIRKIALLYDRPMLQATTLFYSGILHKLSELEKQKGELTVQDYKAINERYGLAVISYWDTKDLYKTLKSKNVVNV